MANCAINLPGFSLEDAQVRRGILRERFLHCSISSRKISRPVESQCRSSKPRIERSTVDSELIDRVEVTAKGTSRCPTLPVLKNVRVSYAALQTAGASGENEHLQRKPIGTGRIDLQKRMPSSSWHTQYSPMRFPCAIPGNSRSSRKRSSE
jgi:hypothetical protein